MDAIYKRRSIRKFTGESIPDNVLREFVKAGMNAPSAGNQQSWVFTIINDRELLNEIPKVHPYSSMLAEAAAAILVCANLNAEIHKGYYQQDCAAATENILLSIAAMDYGAVWLGVFPREERVQGIRNILNIPVNFIPVSLIAVGVPAEFKERKNIFDNSKLKYNKW